MEVNFDVFTGEFDYFEIKRGEWGEEIVESLDTMVKLLYKPVELGESTLKVYKDRTRGRSDILR